VAESSLSASSSSSSCLCLFWPFALPLPNAKSLYTNWPKGGTSPCQPPVRDASAESLRDPSVPFPAKKGDTEYLLISLLKINTTSHRNNEAFCFHHDAHGSGEITLFLQNQRPAVSIHTPRCWVLRRASNSVWGARRYITWEQRGLITVPSSCCPQPHMHAVGPSLFHNYKLYPSRSVWLGLSSPTCHTVTLRSCRLHTSRTRTRGQRSEVPFIFFLPC
jgi:hypothetical protein